MCYPVCDGAYKRTLFITVHLDSDTTDNKMGSTLLNNFTKVKKKKSNLLCSKCFLLVNGRFNLLAATVKFE